MTRSRKGLSNDIVVYGLGHAIGQVIPFIMIPIYTRIFTTVEYGVIDVIVSFTAMTLLITSLGVPAAQTYYFFAHEDMPWKKKLLSTTAALRFAISSVGLVLLLMFRRTVLQLLSIDQSYQEYFVIAILAVPLEAVFSVFTNTCRMTYRKYQFIALNLFKAVLTAVLAVVMLLIAKMGIEGIFYAKLVASFLAVVIGYWVSKEYFGFNIDLAIAKKVIIYGAPLLIAYLSTWILQYSDRYFLLSFGFDNGLGEYALAYKMSAAVILLTAAFRTAWTPFAYDIHRRDPGAAKLYSRVLNIYVATVGMIAVLVALFARPIIMMIAPEQYWNAAPIVRYLIYSTVIGESVVIIGLGVMLTKHTVYSTIAYAIAAVLNILLNAHLIPTYGARGAAIATLISYTCAIAILYIASQHYYRIPYNIYRLLIFVVSTFMMICHFGDSLWNDPYAGLVRSLVVIAAALSMIMFLRLISFKDLMKIIQRPIALSRKAYSALMVRQPT